MGLEPDLPVAPPGPLRQGDAVALAFGTAPRVHLAVSGYQWWSWLLTAVGVFGLWLAGRHSPWGWAVGIGAQLLWFAYAVHTRQWGFIVSCLAYGWVYLRNFRAWRRAARLPVTKAGMVLTPAMEDELAAEAESGYDPGRLRALRDYYDTTDSPAEPEQAIEDGTARPVLPDARHLRAIRRIRPVGAVCPRIRPDHCDPAYYEAWHADPHNRCSMPSNPENASDQGKYP